MQILRGPSKLVIDSLRMALRPSSHVRRMLIIAQILVFGSEL